MYLLTLLQVIAGKILAVFTGLYYLRYLSLPYRLILAHTLIAIIAETLGKYVGVILHEFNIWVFNIYWVCELWLIGIAGIMLVSNKRIRKIAPWLLAGTSVLWVYAYKLHGICVNATAAQCITALVLVIIYFSLLIDTMMHNSNIFKAANFWLSISIISFFSCALPVHGLFNYLVDSNPDLLNKLWNIIEFANQVRYPLVAIAFYLYGSQQKARQNKTVPHVLG